MNRRQPREPRPSRSSGFRRINVETSTATEAFFGEQKVTKGTKALALQRLYRNNFVTFVGFCKAQLRLLWLVDRVYAEFYSPPGCLVQHHQFVCYRGSAAKRRFASSSVSLEPMSNQVPGTFQV